MSMAVSPTLRSRISMRSGNPGVLSATTRRAPPATNSSSVLAKRSLNFSGSSPVMRKLLMKAILSLLGHSRIPNLAMRQGIEPKPATCSLDGLRAECRVTRVDRDVWNVAEVANQRDAAGANLEQDEIRGNLAPWRIEDRNHRSPVDEARFRAEVFGLGVRGIAIVVSRVHRTRMLHSRDDLEARFRRKQRAQPIPVVGVEKIGVPAQRHQRFAGHRLRRFRKTRARGPSDVRTCPR